MEKFLKRGLPSNQQLCGSSSQQPRIEVNLEELPSDPGKRIKIMAYHPNDRENVRRAYLQRGPCQPDLKSYPSTRIGNSLRKFSKSWFSEYGNWLEYSIEKDALFCLPCYLFKPDYGKQSGGDAFVGEGFNGWNKKSRLGIHVGGPNSAHDIAWKKCQDLMKQDQHIEVAMSRQSQQVRDIYRTRLTASIDCICFLLKQGLAFRGHDESSSSSNQGNFLELLKFLSEHNEMINNVVLDNAPENHQLIAPKIQKDIASACAMETTDAIITGIGDDFFAILVVEASDISNKEQMAVALRYVNPNGIVVESFLGIVHVKDTTALSLKESIDELLCKYGLGISRVRGQGYDGASNMQGEFSGLKSLVLKDNKFAYYVHCFAHQLQLTLVAVAKDHINVASLFNSISILTNTVGGSCKRHDKLRDKQIDYVSEALGEGEIHSGKGLNQETSLKRPADTRWSSHYGCLINLILMYSAVRDVLEIIKEEGSKPEQRASANGLIDLLNGFDFAFTLHLMKNVLAISHELSQALERKNQDIINAMNLVNITKQRLQTMRDSGWEDLLDEVFLFCNKQRIDIPPMEAIFSKGKSQRQAQAQGMTIERHYHVDVFYTVLDLQLRELNDRFNETNTKLLLFMASLDPTNSFSTFDKAKLIEFAKFYPNEFSLVDLRMLDNQLETYIIDMRSNAEFLSLQGISHLSEKLVQTRRHIVYPLVYLLLKLALIMPVATATVERAFSAMKIVKNRLRNRMGDEWMNDCLVCYIEKDVFNSINVEQIIKRFQNMKSRGGQL